MIFDNICLVCRAHPIPESVRNPKRIAPIHKPGTEVREFNLQGPRRALKRKSYDRHLEERKREEERLMREREAEQERLEEEEAKRARKLTEFKANPVPKYIRKKRARFEDEEEDG